MDEAIHLIFLNLLSSFKKSHYLTGLVYYLKIIFTCVYLTLLELQESISLCAV